MFYVLQNESTAARRRVPILLTDSATGTTAQSGVALTNIYSYVNINGGAFIGGTGNVGEAGFGQYYYEFDVNEVATLGLAGIHVTAAGCRDYDAITQVAAFDFYSASAGGGISAYDVWAYDYLSDGVVGGSAAERLEETRTESYAASNNTGNIAGVVWQVDLASESYGAGTAGSTLYEIGQGGTALTAGDVWSYVDRTITGGIADTVQLVSTPVDITTASMSGIANTVWDFVITGFGQTGSAAEYTTQTLFNTGNIETYVQTQTPQDVWTYAGIEGRTITGGLADTVTTLTNRSGFAITGGTITTVSDKTGYSLSASQAFDLTGNITGNLSGSVGSVTSPVSITTSNMASIASSVWEEPISTYNTHGTFGYNVLRSDQASAEGNVTLRSAGGINMVDADLHRIDNDVDAATNLKLALTGIGASWTGDIYGTVDAVVNDVDITTLSMSGIANTVWSTDVSGYASPSAGYDLSNATAGGGITAGDVWSYTLSNAQTAEDTLVNIPTEISNVYADTQNIYGDTQQILSDISGLSGQTASDVWSYTLSNAASAEANIVNIDASVVAIGSDTMDIPGDVWSYVLSDTNTAEADLVSAASGGAGISAGDVWSYATRTITGGIADTVTTLTNRSGFAITGGTVDTVTNGVTVSTNNDKSGYSLSGTQSFNLTGNITGNLSGSVGSVSGNVGGSVNSVLSDVPVNEALISADVWGYATRTLTSGAGISAADVWSYATRTITGGTVDNANVTSVGSTAQAGIANSVWRYQVVGALPLFDAGTAGYELEYVGMNVWSEVINGYFGDPESAASYMLRASSSIGNTPGNVWTYATRTLTSGGSGISAADVWNYVLSDTNTAEQDLVSAASGGAGISAGDVWSYGSRTITGGLADTVTTVTNRSGFAITGGSIDTNNDKTGYALSAGGVTAVQSGLSTLTQAQVGTEVDASLSDVGLTSTVTGRIDATVSSRLASASYTAPPTEAAIAGTVWGYATRTLTSGAGATAGDVWTYPTRSLTSGAGITVSAATNIVNGPYFIKSNVMMQDGKLDVIKGMVQDIQLTVVDSSDNPFDVTALGMSVGAYDEAGTAVTSYAVTSLYEAGGIIEFTLDTVVTNTEGRYDLILSAAGSGNTIKFGPLQLLVRPF